VLGLLAARASNGAGRSAGGDGGGTTPTGIRTKIERRRDVIEDSLPANRHSLILKKKKKTRHTDYFQSRNLYISFVLKSLGVMCTVRYYYYYKGGTPARSSWTFLLQ
jgi:hypothetical protein